MKSIPFGETAAAHVTVMRQEDETTIVHDLKDGNMIPRLCMAAGAGACEKACQLKLATNPDEFAPKACAERNILNALESLGVNPENFAMIGATQDQVGFGDDLNSLGSSRHADKYSMVPGYNAFFFRPGVDMTHNRHRKLTHVAMRMADCGDIVYSFQDRDGQDVLGIAHFSRTNMFGPSAYKHEVDDRKVSWGEYVLSQAVEHYGADLSTMEIKLVAAVEGKNFIHHYADHATMRAHFAGWEELGFMHPQGEEDFDCLIDYREMIRWQLTDGIQNPALALKPEQIDTNSNVIDTGDLRLGHASHHAATKGVIDHGRDMYILGLNPGAYKETRIQELERLQAGRAWTMDTFGEMSDDDFRRFEDLYYDGVAELRRLTASGQ